MPKKAVRAAVRMAILSKFQDGQAIVVQGLGTPNATAKPRTKDVAQTLLALRRPDLTERPTAVESGETKAAARKKTLSRRSVLIGLAQNDPVFYRSARNIEGVKVAPVAEFNTYDVLRQRYLILTPESLAILKAHSTSNAAAEPAGA
jgi:large subunit ribosomal protein L4